MLLSTTAGGCGLTFTAARFIILVDLCWNPAADKQAMCRIIRIGQKQIPVVLMLISHGKIDDTLFQVQQTRGLMASMLMGDYNPMQSNDLVGKIGFTPNENGVHMWPTAMKFDGDSCWQDLKTINDEQSL
jgi:SNF2 family DNA or RNA helicase